MDPREDIALSCHESPAALLAIAKSRAERGSVEHIESAFCLLAEAALRGRIPRDDPGAIHVSERLRELNHPLSSIPIWPTDLEQNLRTWRLSRSYGGSVPVFEVRPVKSVEGEPTTMNFEGRATTAAQDLRDLFERLAPTNFRAEAWFGTCDQPIDSTLSAAIAPVKRIPTPAVESLPVVASGSVVISAADAVAAVLDPVVNGGAYNHGAGAAFGRLAGWTALASLVGLPGSSSFDKIVSAVRQARWLWLPTSSPWFYQVAWDGFVGCIGPAGRSLSGLAWTDTD